MVLLAVRPCIIPKPVSSISGMESQKDRESPKQMRPTPNAVAAMGIILVSPRTERRITMASAEMSEPTPTAPIRNPSVCGPPCNTCAAKTGISTMNGQPIRLSSANNSRMVRIGAKPDT